jgi:hypothetical protein
MSFLTNTLGKLFLTVQDRHVDTVGYFTEIKLKLVLNAIEHTRIKTMDSEDQAYEERYQRLVEIRDKRIKDFKVELMKQIEEAERYQHLVERIVDEFFKKNDDLFYKP